MGDGAKQKVSIYTQDDEVIDFLNEYATELGLGVREYIGKDKCPEYSITNKKQTDGKTAFSLQKLLRDENLLGNKHIPISYLVNSKENRLKLLAGLLDSDGYYTKEFNGYEITQKDKKISSTNKIFM